MDMNNNAFKVNNRLHRLDVEVRKQKRKYEGSERNLNTAKWVTGILYFAAICTLYLADPRGMTSYLIENTSEWFAILVFGLASILLPIFLSRTKEDRYSHIAELVASPYRMSIADKVITTLTLGFFLSSGILFEVFTATSQQQHIANNTAEKSGAFKTVQGQQIVVQPDGAIAANLANAQRKLEQCQHKLKEGKAKHCDGDSALVNSLSASQAAGNAALAGASAAAINSQTENLLKITEESNKPVFKMIRDHFKVTINTGMVLAVAIMIFIFEVQHIINLFTYAGRLRRYRELAEEFDELRGELHQETGNDFTGAPEEATPSKVSNIRKAWDELKHPTPAFSPATALTSAANTAAQTIATEYARADHANKQVLADGANAAANYIDKQDFLNKMYKDCRTRILNGDIKPSIRPVANAIDNYINDFRKTTFNAPNFIINMDTSFVAEKFLHKMTMERIIVKSEKGYVISSQLSDNRPTPSTIASTIKMIIDGVDINKAMTADDIKKAVYNTYSVIPNPAPLDDTDLDNVAQKIAKDRGLNQASPIVVEQATTPTPVSRPMGFMPMGYSSLPKAQPDLTPDLTGLPTPPDRIDQSGLLKSVYSDQSGLLRSTPVYSEQKTDDTSNKLAEQQAEIEAKKQVDRLAAEEAAHQTEVDRLAAEAKAEADRIALEAKLKEAGRKAAAEAEAKAAADRIALEAKHQAELAEAGRKAAADAKAEAEAKAEKDRLALEAKRQAEREEADRKAAADAKAKAEADRLAAEEAAHQTEVDRLAAEAKAEVDRLAAIEAAHQTEVDRAERNGLTDEQIELAADVIRNAIQSGHVSTLGFTATSPILKAAGLPVSTDKLKTLIKLACKVLAEEGVTKLNPSQSRGLPIYVIA